MASKTQNKTELLIVKSEEQVKTPARASKESVGLDIYANSNHTVFPNQGQLINTGLMVKPPEGTYIRIAPCSGLSLKYNYNVLAGIIDPDFTGQIQVLLFNHGQYELSITKGDKIAQMIVESYRKCSVKEVKTLEKTERNNMGFGECTKYACDGHKVK
jgi:dUTP pyrophosphatase